MLDAGYNWRTAKISPDLDGFQKHVIKQVKSGFLWTGSLAYYIKDYYGIGLTFQQFGASYEVFGEMNGQTGVLKISDRITFIGPAFAIQAPLRNSDWIVDLSMSIGFMGYVSKIKFPNYNRTASGATFGSQTAIGLSYKFTPQWAIGLKLQTASGILTQYTEEINGHKTTVTFEPKNGESLAQFGISLGVRYYIK